MNDIYQKCKETADYLRERIDAKDAIGLVLGSGLGDLADEIVDPISIDYSEIPNFPQTTVKGHEGKLILGTLNGKKVLFMKGRIHYYEGYTMQEITLPIRVMKLLGVRVLFLTNAAGGVNRKFKPGTLMFIDDFINYMGDNPLRGPNIEEFGERFPDMTKAISAEYSTIAKLTAEEIGIEVKHGVYMAFSGPSYETPAEIKFAERIGADAVGMSTVPELLVARHCNLPVIAISCITNLAAGITGEELSHEEVIETTNAVKEKFKTLVKEIINRM